MTALIFYVYLKTRKPVWCLTCGTMAKSQTCSSTHSVIDVTADTVKNFESLLKLRDDIKNMRDQSQTNLALAIEKRKQVQIYFEELSLSLQMALDEVNLKQDHNNVQLVEMISQLEAGGSHLQSVSLHSSSDSRHEDPVLAELISLVDDANPEDSLETLKEKMKKSVQSSEEKLTNATKTATEILDQRKSKIVVHLIDADNRSIPISALFESGFNIDWPEKTSLTTVKRDLIILSHILHSNRNRKTSQLEENELLSVSPIKPTVSSDILTSNSWKKQTVTNPVTPAVVPSTIDTFSVDGSTFVITVRRHGKLKDEIHIKLSSSCDSQLIRQLGSICYRSPKKFSNTIEKVCHYALELTTCDFFKMSQ